MYVRPYPDLGGRIQVSPGPGSEDPVWSRDSRELVYRSPTHLIAAAVRGGVVTKRDTLFADVYARDSAIRATT